MNYGKSEVTRKLRKTSSKAEKITTKLILILIKILLVLVSFGFVLGISLGYGVLKGVIDAAPEIDMASIEPSGFATMVYDSKGNLTETLVKSGANRLEATYEELPECLINAFIAIEDSRFWSHKGVDFRSILRAVVGVLTGDTSAGGGSTITQQLIKNNVFSGGNEDTFGETLERKIQEQYLAIQLEKVMDKTIILKNYLNTINLGNNTLGVKAAALRYFGKDVSELTLSEATVIAGITQNPTRFNPLSEKGRVNNEEKRRVILQYMYEQDLISKDEQEEALADDVYSRIQNVDIVTRESDTPYSYFTDELIKQVLEALQEKGYSETQASNLLYSGGLSVFTTQDPDLQTIVDEEINNPDNYDVAYYSVDYRLSIQHADGTTTHYSGETMKSYFRNDLGQTSYDGLFDSKEEAAEAVETYKAAMLKEGDTVIGEKLYYVLQPQMSFVLMDHTTGHVKAISGGRGEKEVSLSLNRATDALRQPGSTFKVITAFAPALDTCGATLSTVYYDAPYTVGTKTFRNWYSSKGYMGYSTIRDGIVYSMNIVAVRCMMETVTPQLGVEYARNFGITSLTETDYNAATALGGITKGVSNLELTAAYATIANGGLYTKPVFFTKILDHNGKVLLETETETKRVLKDSTAFLLTDALAESMQSSRMYASAGVNLNSTSAVANIPGMSNAGKSGTTTNNVDIWFVGFTPYYTAGVWSGCDDNQKISAIGSSTSYHKIIWRKIMTRVHEGLADTGFAVPSSIETATVCRKSGMLPNPGVCEADPRGSAVYTEYFARGTVPTEICDHHVTMTVCSESGGLPTDYCPEESRTQRTFMVIPEGETGGTDDTNYQMPGTCTVHTEAAVVLPSEEETESAGPATPETTAPFIPKSPLEDIYIPRGPGYQ